MQERGEFVLERRFTNNKGWVSIGEWERSDQGTSGTFANDDDDDKYDGWMKEIITLAIEGKKNSTVSFSMSWK